MTQPNNDGPYLTRPTTQTDLEARREADFGNPTVETDPNVTNAPYAVEDNDTSAYVGVDPDKMTYANDTEKPLRGEDSVEDEVASDMLAGYAYGTDAKVEGQQTLGSGSSSPVVAVTTSGESVTHAIVDREALSKKVAENDAAAAKGESPEPIRSTEQFVSGGEGKPVEEAEGAPTANPRPTKAPAPKAKNDDDK